MSRCERSHSSAAGTATSTRIQPSQAHRHTNSSDIVAHHCSSQFDPACPTLLLRQKSPNEPDCRSLDESRDLGIDSFWPTSRSMCPNWESSPVPALLPPSYHTIIVSILSLQTHRSPIPKVVPSHPLPQVVTFSWFVIVSFFFFLPCSERRLYFIPWLWN